MDFTKTRGTATIAGNDTGAQKKFYRSNINTLEYGIIANLVTQQYQQGEEVKFETLLAIPSSERIPGLIASYGKKTMHKLLVMILKEFSNTLVLTKAKKLTDTGISITACEIMLSAYEDQLSLEDIILFLQRAKNGRYGVIKNVAHPSLFMNLLEEYRQARHEAYIHIKEKKDIQLKQLGTEERSAPEPTQLNDLLHQAFIIDISNRA